jgi:hypothetical protein
MGVFSNSCEKCGSTEHAYEDCPHSFFEKECGNCGSVEHAYKDCPHSFFEKECSNCGSVEHAYKDCPHSFFEKKCGNCGSVEHAYKDCPHSFFEKECSNCGSVNHATKDCPQGFFARPPRERDRSDDTDDDDLAGGLIKLGLIVGAVVFIFWFIFNVILPFIAINAAIIALISSFFFKDRRSVILPISLLAGLFAVFDYNYGLFVSVIQNSIESSTSFIKYFILLNFTAGLVSAYLIGEKIIADRAADSPDEEAYSRNRSILIGALAFVGIGGIGTQYYFDSKHASSLPDSTTAAPLPPDLPASNSSTARSDPDANSDAADRQASETNDSGIIGSWELVSRQCCGDMIGTDGLPWEQVSKAESERVTFDGTGSFASTSASNPAGKWTLSDASIEGWYIYMVSVEIRGDTMIVFHTPTSSQNAYAEKWQRVMDASVSHGPVQSGNINLTVIARPENVFCYQSLDFEGLRPVHFFNGEGMNAGINNVNYKFLMRDYKSDKKHGIIEISEDKRISIYTKSRSDIGRRDSKAGDKVASGIVHLTVSMNGVEKTIKVYEICVDDGVRGD